MKPKITKTSFDRSQAEEQFEKYKETGNGSIMHINPNKRGYSQAYADGWQRIFGKKEDLSEEDTLECPETLRQPELPKKCQD